MESTRFGIQTVKSPVNVQQMVMLKGPGYLRGLEVTNTTLNTYYALFYDLTALPPAVPVGDPAYVAPKLVLEVPPATALAAKGKLIKTDFQLQDKSLYAGGKDYFTKGICVDFSASPTVIQHATGVYPLSLVASVGVGRMTGFNPAMHGLNIGQEPHPAVVENGVTVVQAGYFDLRPGGNLEQMCQSYLIDGWQNVRFNYVAPTFSKFQNWKDAALVVKSFFPNMLVGITAANGQPGGVTKTQFDSFVNNKIPEWVSWCQANGIKRVGLFNEEANHANDDSYENAGISDYKTYIVQQLFAASVAAKNTLGANVEVSGSFSEGERNTFATQFAAGTAHGLDKFYLNAYDTVPNMVNHVADAIVQFTVSGVCKLGISEYSKDYGINDPIYGGTIGQANSGNEIEQASDMVQRRNYYDAVGLEAFGFCGIDGGVGGVVDQFGLITTTGKRRRAYDALLA